jgi:hypothetical protein
MNTRLNKSFLTLVALGLLITGPALAQDRDRDRDGRRGPPSAETMLAQLSDHLNLSNEQSVDMLVVLQEQAAERAALHEQTMQLLGPEICAQKASDEAEILEILTANQAEQFLQMQEERQARAAERNRSRGGNRPDCSTYEADS